MSNQPGNPYQQHTYQPYPVQQPQQAPQQPAYQQPQAYPQQYQQYPVQHQQHRTGPLTAAPLDVQRQVMYTRPQKGHSLTLHLAFGWIVAYIPTIYFAVSPNHYYHV